MKTSLGPLAFFCFIFIFGGAPESLALGGVIGEGAAEFSALSDESLCAVQARGGTLEGIVRPCFPRDSADRVPNFAGASDMGDPGLRDLRFVPTRKGMEHRAKLCKIDRYSELDYDGSFGNSSPSAQFQRGDVQPGRQVGVGELSMLLLRFNAYEGLAVGAPVVVFEVSPIGRAFSRGTADDGATTGRVCILRDQERKELFVNSMDPRGRRFEGTFNPAGVSAGNPGAVYLKGMAVSPRHERDLRLLLHSGSPAVADASADEETAQPAFDPLLVTVRKKPVERDFINNNAEARWSRIESR